jgi:hypothetical protein
MPHNTFKHKLPGYIATALVTVTTTFWMYWGAMEMYYEGWGNPYPLPLAYLIPAVACLIFALIALTWPRVGGWLLIIVGIGFTIWWWIMAEGRDWLNWRWVLQTFPLSGMLAFVGVLFLLEARNRKRLQAEGWKPDPRWWKRNLRYLVGVGIPLVLLIGVTVSYAPTLIRRVDDGDRGARLIQGNGVTLIWAPEGPGWNWKQEWGGYPSYNSLAFFGVAPIGLKNREEIGENVYASFEDMQTTGVCAYLSEDGTQLLDEAQYIWRFPTVDEIARSLVIHNQNAGCLPKMEPDTPEQFDTGWLDCDTRPDKETPLWAPDREPIYYWAADEYDEYYAYYLGYNGSLHRQNKSWGNPRHGYRCVKEP